jgi:hypothetical protein
VGIASPIFPIAADPQDHMHRNENLKSINWEGLVIGIALIVLLTKLSSYLTPFKMYFSFSSFLFDDMSNSAWLSLTIKLLIPLVVGYVLFTLPFYWMLKGTTSRRSLLAYYRYIGRQSEYTAVAAGVSAAVLQTWPMIEYWDVLVQPEYYRFRLSFLLIYFLYFVSYGYFALLGVYLGTIQYRRYLPAGEAGRAIAGVQWIDAVRAALIASASTGIAAFYGHFLSNPASLIAG